MRSLDDLELERESGGIDDESYTELHDDYTARAAAVLRTLRDGVDVTPAPAPHSPERTRRRVLLVAGVVVFAVLAGVSLAYALGARLPGQTSSGNSVAAAPSTTNASQKAVSAKIKDLEGQVNVKPDDYDLRLQLARAYEENGDLANALKQSDAAISIDPNRAEGHANAARQLYLASSQVPTKDAQAQLVSQALAGFDEAIKVGPDYADAYYFRAVLYAATTQYARSQTDLQYYLSKAPTGEWADQARQLLSQVTTALESPSTTVPPTTTRPPKK
jgi:cytochrome c-type biogenesis protein CcmH/NrfG